MPSVFNPNSVGLYSEVEMTPLNPDEQVASQVKPCEMGHEKYQLHWRNQGNGYNYFFCPYCTLIEFDFESGKIEKALQAKTEEIRELRHNIDAYRGALGYSVPGDHDGRIWGTNESPVNGIASSLEKQVDELKKTVQAWEMIHHPECLKHENKVASLEQRLKVAVDLMSNIYENRFEHDKLYLYATNKKFTEAFKSLREALASQEKGEV